jgi:hypothetical protein
MIRVRGAVIALLMLALAGCTAPPVDEDAARQRIVESMPHGIGSGFTVQEGDALEADTFSGFEGFDVAASAYREFISPGWYEFEAGPAYWVGVYTARMSGPAEAVRLVAERSAAAPDVAGTADAAYEEYGPPVAPRDYLPAGTVERDVRFVWSNGMRSNGWTAWLANGAHASVVVVAAIPTTASIAAAEAAAAEHLPGFVDAFLELEGAQ